MLRHIIGILLATVLVFMFGAFYWNMPFAKNATLGAPDDAAAQAALAEHFPEPGTYFVPSIRLADEQTYMTLYEQGPVAVLHVNAGRPPMQASLFIQGFVHELIVVLLIAALLTLAAPALGTYARRVGFVVLVGVAGSLWVNGTQVVWWFAEPGFPLRVFVYDVLAFALAGLVLAWSAQPRAR